MFVMALFLQPCKHLHCELSRITGSYCHIDYMPRHAAVENMKQLTAVLTWMQHNQMQREDQTGLLHAYAMHHDHC